MVKVHTYPRFESTKTALILLVFAAILLVSGVAQAADSFKIFNDYGQRSADISGFSKWTHVVSTEGQYSASGWVQLVARSNPAYNLETLQLINKQVNGYRYIEDIEGWNKQDYWATPQQFFEKGGGDCEDFAIVKYMALRALGWSADDLRIVVLKDMKLNLLHSVLAVNYEGKTYILDNQSKALVSDRQMKHYVPIYSINENAWWRHGVSA